MVGYEQSDSDSVVGVSQRVLWQGLQVQPVGSKLPRLDLSILMYLHDKTTAPNNFSVLRPALTVFCFNQTFL